MSSSKAVKRYDTILALAKKHVRRDPRFDELSGEYTQDTFRNAYRFIDEYKQEEEDILNKVKKKTKSKVKKKELNKALQHIKREKKAQTDADRSREITQEWKKQEFQARAQGKKPFYLKDSEKKKLILADKFLQFKKTGNLNKVIEKKRTRRAQKDKRWLPPKAE